MSLAGDPHRIPAIPAQRLQLAFIEENGLIAIMALPVMHDDRWLNRLSLEAHLAKRVEPQMAPTQAAPPWILI